MAHHHRAPDPSQVQPSVNDSSHEVKKATQDAVPQKKGKSFFDYEIAGFPWPLVFVILVIALGVLGMVLKAVGLY